MEYKGLAVGNTIKSLRIKKNVSVFELAYRAKIVNHMCISWKRK